ncbi:MAG: hypothetical protein IJU56_04855 [Clostridia bacterium]|nr:hypothetical protein [Clostridia bacterium]
MKKCISLLLTALLVFAVMLPAGATTILPPIFRIADENGYTFTVNETEEGPVLTDVEFIGTYTYPFSDMAEEAYVPKTLGGVPVTTENLTSKAFFGSKAITGFTTDADNTCFSVKDGLLFTKDGATLIAVPNQTINGIFRIPDGTQTVAAFSIPLVSEKVADEKAVCICIPASVSEISPDFVGGRAPAIAGFADSAAQRFAEENGLPFILLGEGHKHSYFRAVTEATCTESGKTVVSCPCGAVAYTEETKPLGHEWSRLTKTHDDGKDYVEIYCIRCNEIQQSYPVDEEGNVLCDCRCHKINRTWALELTKDNWKEVFRNFVFRIKLAYWHMFGINQYCACGARHF